jgi:hypothetical protein
LLTEGVLHLCALASVLSDGLRDRSPRGNPGVRVEVRADLSGAFSDKLVEAVVIELHGAIA